MKLDFWIAPLRFFNICFPPVECDNPESHFPQESRKIANTASNVCGSPQAQAFFNVRQKLAEKHLTGLNKSRGKRLVKNDGLRQLFSPVGSQNGIKNLPL